MIHRKLLSTKISGGCFPGIAVCSEIHTELFLYVPDFFLSNFLCNVEFNSSCPHNVSLMWSWIISELYTNLCVFITRHAFVNKKKKISKTKCFIQGSWLKATGEKTVLLSNKGIITSKFGFRKSAESWQTKAGNWQKPKELWPVNGRNHVKGMHQKPYGLQTIQAAAGNLTSKHSLCH